MKPDPIPLTQYFGFTIGGDIGGWTMYRSRTGKIVIFPRAPPKEPPSPDQQRFRNRFRLVAASWQSLTPPTRQAWQDATRRANLRLSAYALYTYWATTGDAAAIATVAHQASIPVTELIP